MILWNRFDIYLRQLFFHKILQSNTNNIFLSRRESNYSVNFILVIKKTWEDFLEEFNFFLFLFFLYLSQSVDDDDRNNDDDHYDSNDDNSNNNMIIIKNYIDHLRE